MKRDMELIRKIMFKIESDYTGESLRSPEIEGYDKVTVAEHCRLMYEYGLLDEYKSIGADNAPVILFFVGNLTWAGYDFLEKIRQDTVWNRTKDVIAQKGLPMVLDVVKDISSTVITSMAEGAIKAMCNQ